MYRFFLCFCLRHVVPCEHQEFYEVQCYGVLGVVQQRFKSNSSKIRPVFWLDEFRFGIPAQLEED